jgi:CheY-like chemotaxis protein
MDSDALGWTHMDEFGASVERASLRMSVPLVRAALLGDLTSAEFLDVRRCVEADAETRTFSTTARLLDQIGGDANFDLVLVAQATPGEWDGPWIDRLRRCAPLVRVVAVLGTWCEGETRTGRPLAADCRVYWHAFPAWWARQREVLLAGRAPAWSFPEGDWGAVVSAAAGKRGTCAIMGGVAIVAAPTRESAESIAMALRVGGWTSVWVRPPRLLPDVYGAAAIIYDGGQLDSDELATIADLRERYGTLPIVALADFPTIDRAAAARTTGVAVVLGKPFLVEDLLWAVASTMGEVAPAPVAARW